MHTSYNNPLLMAFSPLHELNGVAVKGTEN